MPDGIAAVSAICDVDPNKTLIQESLVYALVEAAFITMYGVLAILCYIAMYRSWAAAKAKTVGAKAPNFLANNRNQVVTSLALGCTFRAFSFIDVDCVYEEILRAIKDMFFVSSFVLIVIFWIELQKYVRQMQSVQKLRPMLYAIMAAFAVFRTLSAIANLALGTTIKNIFNGFLVAIYAFIMGLGVFYGSALLRKMGSMKRSDMKARLQKLTYFIIGENIVLILFLILYMLRVAVFAKYKNDQPWTYFWLKVAEKFLEFICILVLALTMTGKADDGKSAEKPAAPARANSAAALKRSTSATGVAMQAIKTPAERSAAESSDTPASPSTGAPNDRASLLASEAKVVADSVWVKTVDARTGKLYFFSPSTGERRWHVDPSKTVWSVAEFRANSAEKRDARTGNVEAQNPLNADVTIPPPPDDHV